MTTRDEVLAMAAQAGFLTQIDINDGVETVNVWGGELETRRLERFHALAVAHYKEDALIDAVERYGHEVYISKQGGAWSASIGGKNSPTAAFMQTGANTHLRPVLDTLLKFIQERSAK